MLRNHVVELLREELIDRLPSGVVDDGPWAGQTVSTSMIFEDNRMAVEIVLQLTAVARLLTRSPMTGSRSPSRALGSPLGICQSPPLLRHRYFLF